MARADLWGQFKVLVWKNILLKRRNKKQTLQELLFPIYYIAILAMIKGLIKPTIYSEVDRFPTFSLLNTTFLSPQRTSLLVVPDSQYARGIMSDTINILSDNLNNISFSAQYYGTESDAIDAYKANTDAVFAGVVFNFNSSVFNSNLSYAIRMAFNDIASTDLDKIYTDQSGCRQGDGLDTSSCDANTYLYREFSTLQVAIDTALMRAHLNESSIAPARVNVQMMPKPGFTPNVNYIQVMGALFFVIAYSPFVNFLTVNLVAEKEKKIKEGMKMMGLRDLAFWLSWSFVYIVMITLVTVVVIAIATASGVFEHSNMFLFFLMLLLYGLTIIGASFAVTPFFNKAQVAGGMASLASLLISMLYLIVSLTRTFTASGVQYTIPVWGRWILCLLSPVAIALATDQALYLDIVNPDGLSFSTLTVGEFPVIVPLLMMLLDSVLYFLLAVYLDNVVPGEFGPRYPPWYIFSPSFWCGNRQAEVSGYSAGITNPAYHSGERSAKEDDNVEKVPEDLQNKVAVRIDKLTKVFGSGEEKVTAVNGLSLTMYEDQITAILGHNGAGKTTTMNILTGLTGPTQGAATVMGLDVAKPKDIVEIRSMTGVCPQHNILFDDLTCYEHLALFAGIKAVPDSDRGKEILEALDCVKLGDQKDVRASALSGGQKRKLSVAIAVIGDPKIIFLDEPTAGMDPYSRHQLWATLKAKKEGRVILLTTHFMDEADILADRKAILNKGSLRCCGSSLFLKNRFGIGYHLNMVVGKDCDVEELTRFVCGHVAGAELNRLHGQEMDVTLPLAEVTHFAGLFQALEARVSGEEESHDLVSYGVSMTTLEEVFLELEKEAEVANGDVEEPERGQPQDDHDIHIQVPDQQPVVAHNRDETPFTLPFVNPGIAGTLLTGWALSWQRLRALMKIRFLITIRIKQLLFFQIFLPIILLIIGLVVNKNSVKHLEGSNPPALQIGAFLYSSMTGVPPVFGPFGPPQPLLVHDSVGTSLSMALLGNVSAMCATDKYNFSTPLLSVAPHYLGVDLTQLDIVRQNVSLGYTALYNDSAVHSIPALVNLFSNIVFKVEELLAGRVDNNSSMISVSSLPWPTSFQKSDYSNGAFSAVILLAMAYILIPGGLGIEVVKYRQDKVRSQLRISGVPFWVYWASFLLVDVVKFLIPAVLMIAVTFIIKVPSLEQGGAVVTIILLFLTYIPAGILFSYFMSFAFDKMETAQAVQPLLIFFGGFLPYLPVAIVDGTSSASTAGLLHVIFCVISPPYTVFGGLFYIDKVYRVAEMRLSTSSITYGDYFTQDILVAILVPLLHAALSFVCLRIFDVRDTGGSGKEAFGCQATRTDQPAEQESVILDGDEDVREERGRVRALQCQNKLPVAYVSGLCKEFTKEGTKITCKKVPEKVTVAVSNSAFAVDAGEVFGLLGPNGAGKSTTLGMMTADITPTKGQVMIGGHDIRSSISEAFQAMGYCPQYDALWENVTLQEHLDCYARIKGIPTEGISNTVNFFMTNLRLEEHKAKHAKKLSGGTKRKLSYCMSMLGNPQIVLLDEPSTGMDPQSKRFLWDTISQGFRGSERGAILTTHYMEEADVLCSRIAIMVNGKIQCIGSSQHLKSKYGSGYLLEVKLRSGQGQEDIGDLDSRMTQLKQYIDQHFPDAICFEEFSERAQFKIPRNNVSSLAKAFTVLEEGKQHTDIEEYSFSQSTLEQVFLDFAKQQLDEGEELDRSQTQLI